MNFSHPIELNKDLSSNKSTNMESGDRTRASTRDGALPNPSRRASLETLERSRSPAPGPATSTSPAGPPPAPPAPRRPSRTPQQLQEEKARQKEKRERKRQRVAGKKAAAQATPPALAVGSQQSVPQPQHPQQAPNLHPPSSATVLQLRKPPLRLRARRDGSLPRQQQRAGSNNNSNSRSRRIPRKQQRQQSRTARSRAVPPLGRRR